MDTTPADIPSDRWPHPDDQLKVSDCAAILGIHVTTLGKAIRAVNAGSEPSVKNPITVTVAETFAARPLGRSDKITARELMSMVGVDPRAHEGKQPKKTPPRRLRVGKKELVHWGKASAKELLEEFKGAWSAMEAKNTRNARVRVLEIGAVMRGKGLCADDWWMDPSKVILFSGSFGSWLGSAGTGEMRPFILTGPHRRPVDLMSSKIGPGTPVVAMLDPLGYARSLSAAVEAEKAANERVDLDFVAAPGKPPAKDRRRMSSTPTPSEDQGLPG